MSRSLSRRSIESVAWTTSTNILVIVVLFIRSVLLARILAVQTFGAYGYAIAIVAVTSVIINLGLDPAFLNRTDETADEGKAASVLLSVRFLVAALWAVAISAFALIFTEGSTQTALLILVVLTILRIPADIAQMILVRRVLHKRLALLDVADALFSTAFAVLIAFLGYEIWALLITNVTTTILYLMFLVLYHGSWRPQFSWDMDIVRYFARYSTRGLPIRLLGIALDKVDDLWTGTYLGEIPLGFYTRSYSFARYPARIIANPVYLVSGGTLAELKNKPEQLSKAFFYTNALLIRGGFFLGGVLIWIAPEFITILLTDKWLPMVTIFRLMLPFTLLDPLKATIGQLFTNIGYPEVVLRARVFQFIVLIVGLFALGTRFGAEGVALAVDLMLVSGIVQLLYAARSYVEFSLREMFLVPVTALVIGSIVSILIVTQMSPASDFVLLGIKVVTFTACFAAVLLIFEQEQMNMIIHFARRGMQRTKA